MQPAAVQRGEATPQGPKSTRSTAHIRKQGENLATHLNMVDRRPNPHMIHLEDYPSSDEDEDHNKENGVTRKCIGRKTGCTGTKMTTEWRSSTPQSPTPSKHTGTKPEPASRKKWRSYLTKRPGPQSKPDVGLYALHYDITHIFPYRGFGVYS